MFCIVTELGFYHLDKLKIPDFLIASGVSRVYDISLQEKRVILTLHLPSLLETYEKCDSSKTMYMMASSVNLLNL